MIPSVEEMIVLGESTTQLVGPLKDDSVAGLKTSWEHHAVLLDLAESEFRSLESVIRLLKEARYKDCFTLLRTVLESHLHSMLMMEGRKFRDVRRYKVTPDSGRTPMEARDAAIARWRAEAEGGKYPGVVEISPDSRYDDVVIVIREQDGLFDKDRNWIAAYYFGFMEFNPVVSFTGDLPTLYESQTLIPKELVRKQKTLYNEYVYMDHVYRNLELNGLIDGQQRDRLIVHYNFLSLFVHPSLLGLRATDIRSYWLDREDEGKKTELTTLVLLYVLKFEQEIIDVTAGFFKRENPNASLGKYTARADELRRATSDFWFVWDEPTELDKSKSDYYKGLLKMDGKPVPDGTMYYNDPIGRVSELLSSQRSRE